MTYCRNSRYGTPGAEGVTVDQEVDYLFRRVQPATLRFSISGKSPSHSSTAKGAGSLLVARFHLRKGRSQIYSRDRRCHSRAASAWFSALGQQYLIVYSSPSLHTDSQEPQEPSDFGPGQSGAGISEKVGKRLQIRFIEFWYRSHRLGRPFRYLARTAVRSSCSIHDYVFGTAGSGSPASPLLTRPDRKSAKGAISSSTLAFSRASM